MQNHFELVDRFGFGRFEDLLDHAEGAMCEIWRTTADRLKRGTFDYALT